MYDKEFFLTPFIYLVIITRQFSQCSFDRFDTTYSVLRYLCIGWLLRYQLSLPQTLRPLQKVDPVEPQYLYSEASDDPLPILQVSLTPSRFDGA